MFNFIGLQLLLYVKNSFTLPLSCMCSRVMLFSFHCAVDMRDWLKFVILFTLWFCLSTF